MNILKKQDPYIFKTGNKKEKKRHLGVFDLTLMSIGTIIGTGVLVLPGVVAATMAGPSEIISFIIAGIASILVVLCYAEFASSVPSEGGSYTYIYVSLGEIFAYVCGLAVVFGYVLAIGVIANGWSSYLNNILQTFGVVLPKAISTIPANGGVVNLPAILITLLIVYILSLGTRESKKFNNIVVLVKISAIAIFIIVGVFYVKPENWAVFMPFGIGGVFTGASTLFSAYTGFDITASAAEETKNPQKTLPIALISSIVICGIIYIVVSLIVTGIIPYNELNKSDALAYALTFVGQPIPAAILSCGAVFGLLSIIFANCFGTSKILSALSRDNLLPKFLNKSNSKNVPITALLIVGFVGAFLGGFVNLEALAHLWTIALLFVYSMVSISLIAFRKTNPEFKRGFKTPFVPIVPILSILCCGFLIVSLSLTVWIEFGIFLAVILIFYFAYSRKKVGAYAKKQEKLKISKNPQIVEEFN